MKRVLLDENVDRRLKRFFSSDLEVSTVSEEGWSGLTNGKLLKEASLHFEVLVTMDSNLLHQQHPHTININPKPQQYFVLKNLDFCLDIGVHFNLIDLSADMPEDDMQNYDPGSALLTDLQKGDEQAAKEDLRKSIEEGNTEMREKAVNIPPLIVLAYKAVYGEMPVYLER